MSSGEPSNEPDDGAEREYDLVLFGATGFTGGLTARYLATRVSPAHRWAIAGRNRAKLDALADDLAAEADPAAFNAPGIVEADAGDAASLLGMAANARVVLTAVGPYAEYGEPVVKACIEAGTHCLDLNGEPAFLDLVEERYHSAAREKGLRLISCCGLDSIPTDAGAFFTARQLPEEDEKTVRGYLATNARPAGGTLHSALGAIAASKPSVGLELIRPVGDVAALPPVPTGIHRARELRCWGIPTPMVDGRIVRRSIGAHTVYGPRFQYGQYFVRKTFLGVVITLAVVLLFMLAAKIPPTRWLIGKLLPPGTGPSAETLARTWFTFTFVGRSSSKTVITRLSGGDPGYDGASKMLAECGLAIVEEEGKLTRRFGAVSPIGALGEVLISRLQRIGIQFDVLEPPA